MFIYISGVSGAGKTTLVEAVARATGSIPLGGTDRIMEHHGLHAKVEFQERLIERFHDWIPPYEFHHHTEDWNDKRNYRLLDMHFHYFRMNGNLARPRQAWDTQNLKAVFLLNPPPEVVQERRCQMLEQRPDRTVDLVCIRHELKVEMSAAYQFAVDNKVLLVTLDNLELPKSVASVIRQIIT